ncbi:MAG TPA: hypothetical protein VGO00_20840, partial [Kofleriaceae bacterium]|nr:hypothetical protein [Kofleriaceae bacterium]
MSVLSELNVSPIRGVIRRARIRMRLQWALEGATTATVLAAAMALVAIVSMRLELVSFPTGIGVLIGAGAIIVIGAIISASRRLDDEVVARRIDRASSLSDRLSTAIAFHRTLATGAIGEDHETTEDLMVAAIGDGVRAVPRANIALSAPYAIPHDTRAALLFVAISALVAGLVLPMPDRAAKLFAVDPDHARPGEEVMLTGENLLE